MLNLLSRPASAAIAVFSLALVGCGGASSDEPNSQTGNVGGETVNNSVAGALGEMVLGADDAPVTVIEYASVTCPACAAFHERVFPDIKEKYIDTGKVKFIFREFPTAPANLSVAGSMLARCASDEGGRDAYFLVLDGLFKNQRAWVAGENPKDELLKIVAQAGLDEEDFDACIAREELIDLINEYVTEGSNTYGVNSTPSFVIDGTKRSFSSFEGVSKALDEALAKVEE